MTTPKSFPFTPKSFPFSKIVQARKTRGLSQTAFWSRFGVTQAGGSRYESGRDIPLPTAMLMWLRHSGRLSENDLQDARKAVKPKRVNGRAASR